MSNIFALFMFFSGYTANRKISFFIFSCLERGDHLAVKDKTFLKHTFIMVYTWEGTIKLLTLDQIATVSSDS